MTLGRITLVGLAVLLVLLLTNSNGVEARRRRRSDRNQFDAPPSDNGGEAHSMFVLQWPESLCASEKRECIGPIQPFLTIHGLWPIARHSKHCRSDFDPLQLAPIERNLSLVWPSYFKRKTSMSFWKHEYEKHGSCLYATIEEYFDVALRLHRQYAAPLLAALKPSDRSRPPRHFTQALRSAFGVEPMVMCQTQWVPRHRSRFSSAEFLLEEGEVGDDENGEELFEGASELVVDAAAAGYEADVESETDDAQFHEQQLLVEVGLCFARPEDDSSTPLRLVDCPAKGRIRRCQRGRDILFPRRGTFTQAHKTWSTQPSSDGPRIHDEMR